MSIFNHTAMKPPRRAGLLQALPSALSLALLAACSGDGGETAAPVSTVTIKGSVAIGTADGRKGALAGAQVCLDVDSDGACGGDEPAARSGADGSYTLAVAPELAARHGVVAEVPADARTDGATVGRAFVLRAPAGTALISPLSTLVVADAALSGATPAEAEALLRGRAAMPSMLPAELGGGGAADAAQAARVAQLLWLTAGTQTAALDGAGLAAADVAREVQRGLAAALGDVAAAARAADGVAAMTDAARTLAAQIGLTAEAVAAAGRVYALAEPALPDPPVASAELTYLFHTDADNWYYSSSEASAADNVPDGAGTVGRYLVEAESVSTGIGAGATVRRGVNFNDYASNIQQLHWNGSAWVICSMTTRSRSTLRDAQGRNRSDGCNGLLAGTGIRRVEDVSGQDMSVVVRDRIRTLPFSSDWGPEDLGLLAGRRFPAGSTLAYQSNTITDTAYRYNLVDSGRVLLYPAGVAAGGDVRSSPSIDCNNPALTASAALVPATTLEQMIGRLGGKPCIFAVEGVAPDISLDPNSWHGQSSAGIGGASNVYGPPAGTGAFYSTVSTFRVTFTPGGRATFLRCYRRQGTGPFAIDRESRNCRVLGLGTWTIQTLGDARVLSFSTMPAVVQRSTSDPVFIERGGAIYRGSKSRVGTTQIEARLNLTATNAMFDVLALPPLRPVTEPGTATGARAAVLATAQGAWGAADDTDARVFRFGADGRFFLAEARAPLSATREQAGAELGWFDIDPATGRYSTLLQVDTNLTAGTSHGDGTDTLAVSDTAITDSSGFALGRLPDARAAASETLHGMWAVGSPSDLSVPHVVFFANGRAMVISHRDRNDECVIGGVGAEECNAGVEFSEYSYDSATGAVRFFNLLYDTDGCGGQFNTCPTAVTRGVVDTEISRVYTMAADRLSITFVGGDGSVQTLYRVPTRGVASGTARRTATLNFEGFTTLTGFAGAEASSLVADPTDARNRVARVDKSASAEFFAGTVISTGGGLTVPRIDFSGGRTTIIARVWSPVAGIPVRLKAENASDGSQSVETDATVTVASGWQVLSFDFASHASGTPPLDLSVVYNRLAVFFDFGTPGAAVGARTYYIDGITFPVAE